MPTDNVAGGGGNQTTNTSPKTKHRKKKRTAAGHRLVELRGLPPFHTSGTEGCSMTPPGGTSLAQSP